MFDALNDPDNMESSIRFVKEAGGEADCAICYTTDPASPWLGALERSRPREALVLELCRAIEAELNYPAPNEVVDQVQIPGGMYTNMISQLKEAKLEEHIGEVLALVPRVRLDAGLPLVTPTSQIVGVQAVNCVIDKTQGKEMYSNVSKNFAELVKGSYGKTPLPVDPSFREKICGQIDERPYDVSACKRPANPALPECGGALLAKGEKEELLLALFPSVAEKFLKARRASEWEAANPPEPEKPGRYPDELWENLALTAGV